MALAHSPKVVTDGLVFAYDMGNAQKSWIGRPTTNFINASTVSIGRYNNPGFSGTVFNTGETYKGMPIWETTFIPQDSSFIPRLGSTEGFGAVHSMETSLAVNNRYMASIYFRRISPLQNSPTLGFNNTYSNIAGWGQNGTSTTRIDQNDGWIRLYSQYLNTSSTLTDGKYWKITFDTTGVQVGQTLRAQWAAPMLEQHDTVYPSTFVNGTRSNTQAILDLTNNNTVTANSLTYSNDGLFSFNGSSNYITASASSNWAFGANGAIEQWIYPTNSTGNDRLWCVNNNSSSLDAYLNGSTYNLAFHGGTVSGGTVTQNAWNHVCVTYTAGVIQTYINGVASVMSGTTTGYNITNAGTLIIGEYQNLGGYKIYGSIPVMRVYNRALTASEVAQNFQVLRGRYDI
jgi:hypothetical protein